MRDGWREVTLGSVVERRTDFVPVVPDQKYTILGVQRSGWGFVEREPIKGSDQKFTKLLQVAEDDLVYRTITAFEAPAAVVGPDQAGKFVTPQTFPVFRIDQTQMLPRFMEALTTWPTFHEEMSSRCTGSVLRRKTLSIGAFESIPLSLPPLDEQRRIVDLIGALDDTLAAADKVASGLEPAWWAMARKLQEDCVDVPVRVLGDISDIHGGLTKNKKDAERPDAVEVPYLRVANVHRRRLVLDDVATIVAARKRVEAALLKPGDLLMNEGGDRDKLGRGAVWRGEVEGCTHQNHVFRVRITDEEFVPEFVSAWANSFGQKWFEVNGSQTTGIASISKTTLSRFPVPAIPRADQTRWSDLLDTITEHEWQVRGQVDRLRALRSNLLTALLSGEHEIPESYDELMEESAA